MNSQLADLSHLIPSNYLKKVIISELNLSKKCLSKDFFFIQGRGRIEKTEIVEMAIKHIKHLHQLMETQRAGASASSSASCSNEESADAAAVAETKSSMTGSNWQCPQEVESFRNGFNECTAEAIHFLVDKESVPPGIINHIFKARRSKKKNYILYRKSIMYPPGQSFEAVFGAKGSRTTTATTTTTTAGGSCQC